MTGAVVSSPGCSPHQSGVMTETAPLLEMGIVRDLSELVT